MLIGWPNYDLLFNKLECIKPKPVIFCHFYWASIVKYKGQYQENTESLLLGCNTIPGIMFFSNKPALTKKNLLNWKHWIALFSKLNEFSSFVDDELVEAELGQTLLFFNFLSCFLIKILQLEIGNILNCAQDNCNHSNWQPFISQAKHFFSQREGQAGDELCQAQSS